VDVKPVSFTPSVPILIVQVEAAAEPAVANHIKLCRVGMGCRRRLTDLLNKLRAIVRQHEKD